jgi:hypothetical protein
MKNSQKITRIHLPPDDHDIPITLGIVSPDPDYKITLKLNKKLGISLKNTNPVEFKDDEGNSLLFSRFSDTPAAPWSIIQLLSNRSDKNFLLKKLRKIDYLLLIHDPGKNLNLEHIISHIREIESVTGVFTVEIKTLKDKNLKYLI